MPKWLSDYHYGRITGLPGNSVAGAVGAAEYNRNNPVVKIKIWPTVIGLVAGASPAVWGAASPWALSQLTAIAGDWSLLLGSAIGACLGSLVIPMIGVAIMMTAALIGLVIALAILTALLAILYLALAAYIGWPPFTAAEPTTRGAVSDVAVIDVFKG